MTSGNSRHSSALAVNDRGQVLGRVLRDCDGQRLGVIRDARCDPENPYRVIWAYVTMGALRGRPRLVPLLGATFDAIGIVTPYPRALIRLMPHACSRDLDDARMLTAVSRLYQATWHARAAQSFL